MSSSTSNSSSERTSDGCCCSCSTSASASTSAPPRRRAVTSFACFASLTLSVTAAGKGDVEILPLGFESGSNGGGSRRSSGGGDDNRRKQQHATSSSPSSSSSKQQSRPQKRYAWDGNRVVSLDGEEEGEEKATKRGAGSCSSSSAGKPLALVANAAAATTRSCERALDACYRSFFPDPSSVSPDYWSYCRWRGAHRLCSSMLTNFATQALLAAVGVGASRSLPAAAGINWLLKDGLGRVGRLGVATRFGEAFDADIKRFRFATSVLFTASIGLELATPAFPKQFLALAAAANVGKAVGLTTYISTQPSFGASFARGANLADVTAKAQAQQMVVDTLGLALCVETLRRVGVRAAAAGAKAGAASSVSAVSASSVSAVSASSAAAVVGGEAASALAAKSASAAFRRSFGGGVPLPLLALLAAGDLFCIAKELKSVHLRTLNRERAELAAEAWLESRRRGSSSAGGGGGEKGSLLSFFGVGRRRKDPSSSVAPSPETIAEAEPLLFPARPGKGLLPLRFSRLEDAGVTSREELDDALSRRSSGGNDKFLLVSVDALKKGKKTTKKEKKRESSLRLVLRSDARAADALVGVLAAAHARAELLEKKLGGERKRSNKKESNEEEEEEESEQQQRLLLSRATAAARRDGPVFFEALEDAGWQMEPFLLSPRERGGLVVLG